MKRLAFVLGLLLSSLLLAETATAQVFWPSPIPVLDGRNTAREKLRLPVLPPILPNIPGSDDSNEYCHVNAGVVFGVGAPLGTSTEWLAGEGEGDCSPVVLDRLDKVCIERMWPAHRYALKCTDWLYDFGPRYSWNRPTPRMGLNANLQRVPGDYRTIYFTEFTWNGQRIELSRHSQKRYISQ